MVVQVVADLAVGVADATRRGRADRVEAPDDVVELGAETSDSAPATCRCHRVENDRVDSRRRGRASSVRITRSEKKVASSREPQQLHTILSLSPALARSLGGLTQNEFCAVIHASPTCQGLTGCCDATTCVVPDGQAPILLPRQWHGSLPRDSEPRVIPDAEPSQPGAWTGLATSECSASQAARDHRPVRRVEVGLEVGPPQAQVCRTSPSPPKRKRPALRHVSSAATRRRATGCAPSGAAGRLSKET